MPIFIVYLLILRLEPGTAVLTDKRASPILTNNCDSPLVPALRRTGVICYTATTDSAPTAFLLVLLVFLLTVRAAPDLVLLVPRSTRTAQSLNRWLLVAIAVRAAAAIHYITTALVKKFLLAASALWSVTILTDPGTILFNPNALEFVATDALSETTITRPHRSQFSTGRHRHSCSICFGYTLPKAAERFNFSISPVNYFKKYLLHI